MEWAVLAGLGEEDRKCLLERCIRRRFSRNEMIFHEGDPGDTMHLIAKGRVAIRVATPLGDVATLTILGSGDFFGELALFLPGDKRTASALALEPVETRAITRDVFLDLRRAQPSVESFVTEVMATQIRRLTQQLLDALFVPADRRVLRRLLDVLGVYHAKGAGTVVSLTQEDLASLAGTTRPTVNRVLKKAQEAGLLSVSRGQVEVHDPEGLARRAR